MTILTWYLIGAAITFLALLRACYRLVTWEKITGRREESLSNPVIYFHLIWMITLWPIAWVDYLVYLWRTRND